MRTTVSIDDDLLRRAKQAAGARGETLGSLVEEALRRLLAETTTRRPGVELPLFVGGTGPRPGVDLTSNAALEDLTDEDRRAAV